MQREGVARAEVQQLKQVVRDQQTQIAELTQRLEALQAEVAWLQQQVFGRKSEQTLEVADQACGKEDVLDASDLSTLQRPKPIRYCGRVFTAEEIERICRLIASEFKLNRAQLSRRVCDELHWHRANGRRKEISCRVAMLRMVRNGLITLPPPQKGNGNGCIRPRFTAASDPKEPMSLASGA